MNTYDVSTKTLLEKYGNVIDPKHRASYKTLMSACPKGTLQSNWVYFQIRLPLIKMDGGNAHVRTSARTPKVLCEQLTREQWLELWDNAHTNPYQQLAKQYADKTIASMNQV